jgi:predicted MFS family arabinose efflux permease
VTGAARYRLIATLYCSQFLALGFFYYALAAVLRRNGVGLAWIGLLQFLGLFQVVRFLWAPLVDRYGWARMGHYRSWLVLLHVLMVVAVVVLGPLDVIADLPLVLTAVAAIAFLSATQDIAADATAVRLLAPPERSIGNGIQMAGSYGGFVVGGNVALVVYDRAGWAMALTLVALLTAMPLPLLLRYREPPALSPSRPPVLPRRTRSFFRQPGAVLWAFVVMPVYYLGIASAYPLITPILVDAGWSLERIGVVLVLGGGTSVILGALAGGLVLGTAGRRLALVLFGLVQVVAAAGLQPLTRPEPDLVIVLAEVALLHLAYGLTGTAIFALSMDWTRPMSAGTDYSLQACFAQLCSHGAGAVALAVAEVVGYSVTAALSTCLGLVGTAAAWLFGRRLLATLPGTR